MIRKIIVVVACAALFAPGTAAADPGSGQDRANAARACQALRTSMGEASFRLAYGTAQSNRRNAFGRCVSQSARAGHESRHTAQAACEAERNDPDFPATHGGKTFDQYYGVGPQNRNAFGRCVSSKAREAALERREATVNAARRCREERRTMGEARFRSTYGSGPRDANAFGKCVSRLAKQQNG